MGSPKTPKVVERNPVKEQLEAERKATLTANAEIASRKKDMRYSSFLATGGGALAAALPVTMGNKQTLGGA
jgi:hypothetical protein